MSEYSETEAYVGKWVKSAKEMADKVKEMEHPLAVATQFAELISHAKGAGLSVIVPQIAEEWAGDVIQEFAFLVVDLARLSGAGSRIIDRDLFDPNQLGSVAWNEGIVLKQVLPHDDANLEPDFYDENDYYGEFGYEPSLMAGFRPNFLKGKLLSGQYNRFFPLKIVMRVAANLLLNSEGYKHLNNEEEDIAYTPLLLEELRSEAAKIASYAKKRMEWLDSSNGTEYGSWFSVALTDGSKKQDERFMSQFVGSVRNEGQGLPFELGFLDLDDGIVKITELGLKFTLAENQIIDKSDNWRSDSTLTQQEKKLLMFAIKRNVPSEYELMNELIGKLKDGTNTPKKIEVFLKEKFSISDTEASLQRTGIFARMQELGVVKRVKEGRTVIYEVVN